jgi:hypothetical protein
VSTDSSGIGPECWDDDIGVGLSVLEFVDIGVDLSAARYESCGFSSPLVTGGGTGRFRAFNPEASIIASNFATLSLRLALLFPAAVSMSSRLCSVQSEPRPLHGTQVEGSSGRKIHRIFLLRPLAN